MNEKILGLELVIHVDIKIWNKYSAVVGQAQKSLS